MPDIHPAVDAGILQKQKEISIEKKRARRRANKTFIRRAVVAIVLIIGLWLAMVFDLMAPALVIPLEVGVMIWIGIWFGAWLQFMFADGGLLDAGM